MKMQQKGRGITLATLVLALGAAVYMNWSFTQEAIQTAPQQESAQATQADGESDGAVAVYDPLQPATTDAAAGDKNYGEAQLVSANQDSGTAFFEQARLARSKARDEALDAIQKTLKSPDLSEEEKEKLTQELESQVSNITSETSLEGKVKAKGFADCVVTLGPSRADITVMTENDALTAREVTQIRDVILNSCPSLSAQDITIVEVK